MWILPLSACCRPAAVSHTRPPPHFPQTPTPARRPPCAGQLPRFTAWVEQCKLNAEGTLTLHDMWGMMLGGVKCEPGAFAPRARRGCMCRGGLRQLPGLLPAECNAACLPRRQR